jgi:hypothetical protein
VRDLFFDILEPEHLIPLLLLVIAVALAVATVGRRE